MANTNAIRSGKAYVELFADSSKLVKGLRLAESKLRSFGSDIQSVGQKMLKIGSLFSLPLIAGAKVYGDFEEQMANVSTMLDEPEKHMARFSKAIRDMSVEFGESTATLAGGLYDILSASIEPAKALDVLAVAVKAAKAGLTDTKTAADAITTVLNAYGLSADYAADVSDLLFSIVKRGKTTFAQLAPSIGQTATIAATAGISFEELGAAVATMTRSGIQTENAMTALNAIITTFLKPADDAVEFAKTFGLELSAATLETKGLAYVLEKIANLPPDAIARLFPNIRALKGVLPALKNLAGFTSDIEAMANRAGAAEVAYQKMAGTLAQSFRKVKQAGLLVLSIIGEQLADSIKKTSDVIIRFGKAIADIIGKKKQVVVTIAKVIAIVGLAGAALITFGFLLKTIAFGFGALATVGKLFGGVFTFIAAALKLIISPVGLVITAVSALAAAILYFTGSGATAVDWLGDKFSILASDIKIAMSGISAALAKGDIGLAAKIMWLTLKTEWIRGINFLAGLWLKFKHDFLNTAFGAFYGMQAAFEIAVNSVAIAMIETTAALKKAWADFTSWHAMAVEKTANWIAKKWYWLKSLFDESIDLKFANENIDNQSRQQLDKINKDRDTAIDSAEQNRANMRNTARKEHEDNLSTIGKGYEEKADQLQADYETRLSENEKQLAEAKKQWQDAITEAKETGPQAQSGDIDSAVARLKASLDGIGDYITAQTSKITIAGTFNSMQLAGLGSGSAIDRTANACEQTARNTQKLVNKAQTGGLVFE